jgi:CRISPR-associated protein (TIGR03986 family)
MSNKITAPYNFVPLNKKVIIPYWGPTISHDKPFVNGESGVLEITMTANSLIYVRNGEIRKKDLKGKELIDSNFNQFQGKHFIPGSSIKGMLRNFIEIMTFSRMEDKVNDVKYAVRDFSKGAKDAGIYDPSKISKESQCGWLKYDGRNFLLTPCSRPGRISHEELDKLTPTKKISTYYENKNNLKGDKFKSAISKYENFTFEKKHHTFIYEKSDEGIGREIYTLDLDGKSKGTIVLTGQPGERKPDKNQGKHYEFIFFDFGNPEFVLEKTQESQNHEVIRNFFHAYYDHDKTQQKDDWKCRKRELENGISIPVFYRLKDDKRAPSSSNMLDMGLTLVYKTTYKYSVRDSILNYQKDQVLSKPDFSDCIFGYIKKANDGTYDSLKGRVIISHAFATLGVKIHHKEKLEVLGGPKASYYPNYMHQNFRDNEGSISGNYLTFKDQNGCINGWKKYPVRSNGVIENPPPLVNGKRNEDVASKFIPLESGAKFTFQIAYHNLRNEELGALISAITFHGNEGFYHSIGMAKPLGYGKVSFEINGSKKEFLRQRMTEFEDYMNFELGEKGNYWVETVQIKELFTMAKPSDKGDASLIYQKMDMENRVNDFQSAKADKKALLKYSSLSEPVFIKSLSTDSTTERRKQYHKDQSGYFEFLNEAKKDDPTAGFKKAARTELSNKVKEAQRQLINSLAEKQQQLREEKVQKEKAKLIVIDQEITRAKLNNPIDLSRVKSNSRAFLDLEKVMRGYQVKYKTGFLEDENDVAILKEKLKEIYQSLSEKEKSKWADTKWAENHYFKKIERWLGQEIAKGILENP